MQIGRYCSFVVAETEPRDRHLGELMMAVSKRTPLGLNDEPEVL